MLTLKIGHFRRKLVNMGRFENESFSTKFDAGAHLFLTCAIFSSGAHLFLTCAIFDENWAKLGALHD